MNQDINKKLADVLGGMDKTQINNAKRSMEQLLNSKEGKDLREKLMNMDKSKLLNKFMKMDTNQLKNILSKANLSDIEINDIKNKLK